MTVVLGGLTPHATALIPEAARRAGQHLEATLSAVQELMRQVANEEPDVVIIATPHGPHFKHGFGVRASDWHMGDLAAAGAAEVSLDAPGDPALAEELLKQAKALGVPIGVIDRERDLALDHGLTVPLYFLKRAGYAGTVLPVSMCELDREAHRAFGQAIARAVSKRGLRGVLLASGDLSHHLGSGGDGFDRTLLSHLESGHWEQIYELDEVAVQSAGQCAYHSLLVLLGALENSLPQAQLLAYEGAGGVGYATVTVTLGDSAEQDTLFNPAGYARQVADSFLQSERIPPAPSHFPHDTQGVWVCLHRDGLFSSCAGSLSPQEPNLASAIARYALVALQDYAESFEREHPLTIDELHHLCFTVYLAGPPEDIAQLAEADPEQHGLVVLQGDDYGIALPEPGVKRPEDLLERAITHGRLDPEKPFKLQRFEASCFLDDDKPAW